MLKIFVIFCLVLITQVVLSSEDQKPTSTTPTKEKRAGGIGKIFNNQLSGSRSTVTNLGQGLITDTVKTAIENDLEQEEEENQTSTTSTEETKEGKKGFVRSLSTQVGNAKDTVVKGSTALVSGTMDVIESAINNSVNQIPEELRPHFLTILTLIFQLTLPGGIVLTPILPVVDIVAKNVFSLAKRKGRKNKLKMKPRDTTDIILYTLIAEDVNDDQQLQKLTDLGLESDVVKQIVGSFILSWKEMVDAYVQNYYQTSLKETIESILKQSETKNDS